ncbi:MAG: serine/threonine-protein kinase [bacterium]
MVDDRGPDPARARAIAEIFADALGVAIHERAAWLESACGSDPALRAEVESLLDAHAAARDAFRTPIRLGPAAEPAESRVGRELGPYRIVALIASGGMGSVYEGERVDRQFEKRVAIKLVRAGMGTPELLERFRAERQVLADLEHPNIARLLDGGSTADGVPFLVMEFVDGTPIDRFADDGMLPIDARLRLFLEVCDAVQFAHRHLVVHRDLKPSNILVDHSGRVKLLDFGIAKVLAPSGFEPSDAATLTAFRALTPRYASPEQLRHQTVTTATDVYSLGVLLFELLTGARPYGLEGRSASEVERIVCETPVPRPSAVVRANGEAASAAAGRRLTPERLARRLEGDLDTITLKAIAKEPARRYAGVEELAADVRRYLGGEAVLARPDSAAYRLEKFARRHRAAVAGALSALALLVAFTIAMGVQARRVATERDRANASAAQAEAVNAFLRDMLASVNPAQADALGRAVSVQEALDQASRQVEGGALAQQPHVEAAVRQALGTSYQGLGLYPTAEPHLEAALAIQRRLHPEESREVAAAIGDLGTLRRAQGRIAEADSLFGVELTIQRRLLGDHHPAVASTINDLGVVRREQGDLAAAEKLHREALAIYRKAPAGNERDAAANLANLALVLSDQHRAEEAEPLFREAVDRLRDALGPHHRDVAAPLSGLGQLLRRRGDLAGADSAYGAVVEIRRRALGEDHPDFASALNNLAVLRRDQGDLESAEALMRQTLSIWRRSLGDQHPFVATGAGNLALLLGYRGHFAAAESLYREALETRRRTLGADHPDVALSLYQLGVLLLDAGQPGRADSPLRESLDIRRRKLPSRDPEIGESMAVLGRCLLARGRAVEAEGMLREAAAIQEERGSRGWRRFETTSLLGSALAAQRRYEEAEPLLLGSSDSLSRLAGTPAIRRTQAKDRLAAMYQARGLMDR